MSRFIEVENSLYPTEPFTGRLRLTATEYKAIQAGRGPDPASLAAVQTARWCNGPVQTLLKQVLTWGQSNGQSFQVTAFAVFGSNVTVRVTTDSLPDGQPEGAHVPLPWRYDQSMFQWVESSRRPGRAYLRGRYLCRLSSIRIWFSITSERSDSRVVLATDVIHRWADLGLTTDPIEWPSPEERRHEDV